MHPEFKKADALSSLVIGAAIEVHRHKGPGLIESIYEKCLLRELQLRGVNAVNQLIVPIEYKGLVFEEPLRLDVYAEGCLIVENKVVEKFSPSTAPNFSATCACSTPPSACSSTSTFPSSSKAWPASSSMAPTPPKLPRLSLRSSRLFASSR